MAQRFLSNIKVNDAYTLPASDGTNGQAITTDGSGTLSFSTIDSESAERLVETVKNMTGATLTKTTPIHFSGENGGVVTVVACDASNAATMPCHGVLNEDIANNATGEAIVVGEIKDINTSSFTAGDTVYVAAGGGYTSTKPTGTALIQNIANIKTSHSSTGKAEIFGAGRTNDVPNITENYIWLGNSSGVATATEHLLSNVKDVTTSSPTDGQVLTWDNTNSYWKNADAASGGSGGTVTVEVNYSGDGTTQATNGTRVAFTVSSSISNEANTQVFIDGVYQAKDKYSVSGTTLTFESGNAPPSGTTLEIVHLKTVDANIALKSHTANGTATTFNAGGNIANENNTQVYIDGVYQNKGSYTVSGGNVDFGTGNAPANGTIVEIIHIIPRGAGGITWQSTAKTANFTAVAGEGYFVDTSSSAITVTLPSSPSVGDEVTVVDYGDNSSVNNITFTSSDDIMNSSDDRIIDTDSASLSLVYSGATKGWLHSKDSKADLLSEATATFDVDFLVVAGGGGSGRTDYYGGGGGAGGFRTSISADGNGGGQAADSAITVTEGSSNTYTVTVGSGGTAPSGSGTGTNGLDSIFATITSKGGGGGANYNTNGLDGGSGGGGGGHATATSGGSALTSPVIHGYAGASTTAGSDLGGGGGGGAGGAGQWTSSITGGTGGAPLDSTITGSSVYYAGGGGGTRGWTGSHGVDHANSRAVANSGDGGTTNVNSGNGYSGIVILKYPDTYTLNKAAGHTTSELNVASGAGYKRTTFTGGTGNIYFTK